jgi:hypothetical protein
MLHEFLGHTFAWRAKWAGDEAVRQGKLASAEREEATRQRETARKTLDTLRKSMLISRGGAEQRSAGFNGADRRHATFVGSLPSAGH